MSLAERMRAELHAGEAELEAGGGVLYDVRGTTLHEVEPNVTAVTQEELDAAFASWGDAVRWAVDAEQGCPCVCHRPPPFRAIAVPEGERIRL